MHQLLRALLRAIAGSRRPEAERDRSWQQRGAKPCCFLGLLRSEGTTYRLRIREERMDAGGYLDGLVGDAIPHDPHRAPTGTSR